MSVRLPRGRRGTAATLTAFVGLAAAAVAAVFAFHAAVRHRPWLVDADAVSRWARETTFGSTTAMVVGVVVGVVGLVLVLAAVLPPRRGLVELAGDDDRVAAGMTRRGLQRTLRAAATGIDGIGSASVSGRRTLTVRATTSLRGTEGLADRVQHAVESRLALLEPAAPHPVRVRLSRKER